MLSPTSKTGLLLGSHAVLLLLLVATQLRHEYWSPRVLPNLLFLEPEYDRLASMALSALLLADAGMLGLWGAFGATRAALRALTIAALDALFFLAVPWAGPESAPVISLLLLICLPSFGLWGALAVLRKSRARLTLVMRNALPDALAPPRFTLAHAGVAVAIVSTVLALGRAARSLRLWSGATGYYELLGALSCPTWWPGRNEILPFAVLVAVFVCCVSAVEAAIAWAALGVRAPALRLGITLPLAALIGALPRFYLENAASEWWTLPATLGLQGAVTAVTLLTIRSAGYRLVVSWPPGSEAAG